MQNTPLNEAAEATVQSQQPKAGATRVEDSVLQVVARVWCELLQVDEIEPDGNFFMLGGDSLLATRVVSHLRKLFGIEVPLAQLFQSPTPQALADAIKSAEPQPGKAAATAEILLEFVTTKSPS